MIRQSVNAFTVGTFELPLEESPEPATMSDNPSAMRSDVGADTHTAFKLLKREYSLLTTYIYMITFVFHRERPRDYRSSIFLLRHLNVL